MTARSDGEGKGASFHVRIPVIAAHPRIVRGERTTAAPANTDPDVVSVPYGVRVLLVDDDEATRDVVATVLSQRGAEVQTASSAAEGLLMFSEWRPNVIVSDIGMPGEDGVSFVRRLRAAEERGAQHPTPAIALTAYARKEDKVRVLEAGFNAHLAKPIEPDELANTVGRLATSFGALTESVG